MPKVISIPVNPKDVNRAILKVLNFNLKLSDLEIDIIATLLNHKIEIIDTSAREIVRKELNKSKFITNNYILRLRDRSMILETNDGVMYLNPNLKDLVKDKDIQISFIPTNDNN